MERKPYLYLSFSLLMGGLLAFYLGFHYGVTYIQTSMYAFGGIQGYRLPNGHGLSGSIVIERGAIEVIISGLGVFAVGVFLILKGQRKIWPSKWPIT